MLTPQEVEVKFGRQRNYHEALAAITHLHIAFVSSFSAGGAAVRGGAPRVHLAPHRGLHPPRHPHRAPLPPPRPQGGPGVREGGHLPPRPHPRRRRARTRHLLHPPLHGQVRDRGHARAELVRAAAGDDHAVRPRATRVTCHDVMRLVCRDSVTVYVNAIMYYRVVDAVKVSNC